MNREPSRTPGLPELLKMVADSVFDDAFFCCPGKVEKYDDLTQKASVLPLLKRTYLLDDGTKEIIDLPKIDNVPVVNARGGGFYVSMPLEKDDLVLLVFCDRSIDKYKSSTGSQQVDPVDLRTNDITDAVAIPGFYPFSKALKSGLANKGKLALGYDDGGSITIDKNSEIVVTNSGGTFTLKPSGQVDINGHFTVDP